MLDVIYMNTLPDTDEFGVIFKELPCTNVLVNPNRRQVNDLLSASTNRLLICGHGDECGVYGEPEIVNTRICWGGHVLDRSHAELLRRREVIGIWCYAGNFADNHGLHGFFTSMFISNTNEAADFGFKTDAKTVSDENVFFAKAVRHLVENGVPLSEWVWTLQHTAHTDIPFVRFNYEALAYYE